MLRCSKMLLILLLALCPSIQGTPGILSSVRTSRLEYYMKLIRDKVTDSILYEVPTDNRKYFGDSIPDESSSTDFGEFDFIIVGAGSSGSVILNRLSEKRTWKILMLEAGDEETDFSDIPTGMIFNQFSDMNWGYFTTPQKKSFLGMNNNQCSYPRGKVLGGSSTINALMYVRGNKDDYDTWEKQGNPGWSYENVLPFFKKSEHFEIEDGDSKYHSRRGLWNVTYARPPATLTQNFLDANEEMGYKYVDYNGKNQMGYSKLQFNINRGKRASGGRTFIDSVRNKQNVYVVTKALVTKVLIDSNNQAYGVLLLKNRKLFKATARKEVILSAGAINTPQLLMLSGIGPKRHLKELKIPVKKDLPVGKHLEDHPVFIALNIRTNFTFVSSPSETAVKEYLKGEGILTYCANTHALKFINTLKPQSTVPDIELIFLPPPSLSITGLKMYNIKPENDKILSASMNASTDFRILVILLHPKSMGEVTLKTNDPLDFPNINTNYFSDKNNEDVETIYRGILHALTMLDTKAFKKINATFHLNYSPCEQNTSKYSREYWHCVIRHLTYTLYHPSGTTRMGPNPKTSVVNHRLQVHGINKLRVADCGIIPSATSGHTAAPAVMIGERMADFLKQKYWYS